jgi:general secretion pathway protein D
VGGETESMRRLRWLAFLAFAAFLPGSGVGAQDTVQAWQEGVRLDFQDVDLRFVISALAEAGNLNVVYADLPLRSVTLRMSRPVAPDEILPLLRSLAASNGLEVIEEGELIRVVGAPSDDRMSPEVSQGDEEPGLRLYVYQVRHARASRLATTLQALFGGTGQGASGSEAPAPRSLTQQLRDQRIPSGEFGTPAGAGAVLESQAEGLPGELLGRVQIVPEETTNSLLIRAQPGDWEVIRQSLEALDLRPLQVLIEVVIAEVRRTSGLELGASLGVVHTDGEGPDDRLALSANSSAGGFVLDIMQTGSTSISAVISALATSGNVHIVSRPVILAQNNQQARIMVGDERPFIQVSRTLPTDAAVRDEVIQYRDVGTSLTITPTINADGYVNLELIQEVSNATSEEQFGAPVISTREAATQLFVRDGQTVVIGGLIDRLTTETESGIPLLKDIPWLGNLFKTSSKGTIENELFLFLTPHIIVTDEDAQAVLEDLGEKAVILRPDTMNAGMVPDTIRGGRLFE